MDGGAILRVILIAGVFVLSTIGLTFIMFGSNKLESDRRIEPSIEIHIKDGVSDTTFIYQRKKQ